MAIESVELRVEGNAPENGWVRETMFGRWFLRTDIWFRYVLGEAMTDFKSLLGSRMPKAERVLDAGCGQGLSFALLEQLFQPKVIVGVDIDSELLGSADEYVRRCECDVRLVHGTVMNLHFPDNSFDVVFCHQLIHHVSAQARALQELYRVLAPGGTLLISESCRAFINSFPVRLLFRHPMKVQKTAEEYVNLVRSVGFEVADRGIKESSPWWSLPDLGLCEKICSLLKIKSKQRETTEVLIVARKPV